MSDFRVGRDGSIGIRHSDGNYVRFGGSRGIDARVGGNRYRIEESPEARRERIAQQNFERKMDREMTQIAQNRARTDFYLDALESGQISFSELPRDVQRSLSQGQNQQHFQNQRSFSPEMGHGRQQYRDDLPFAPDGVHPQSRGPAVPVQERLSDDFSVSNGKDRFEIDNNGVAINGREQRVIAGQLSELKSWGGGDRELDALRTALDNGLSPDARIQVGRGKEVSLDEFVKDSILRLGREKEALAMIQDARENPVYTEKSQAQAQGQSSDRVNEWQFEGNQQAMLRPNYQGRHNQSGEPKLSDLSELINSETVTRNGQPMNDYNRLMAIQAAANVTDSASAKQFHSELAQNPNMAANYMALVEGAGRDAKTPEERNAVQGAALSFMAASQSAKHFDPSGHDAAAARIMSGAGNNPNADAVRARVNNTPTTDELARVTIADEALNRRLQAAVGEQRKMDEMVKNSPLLGMFMAVLRPLFNMFNPDSDPMNVIAEAKENGVAVSGPESVMAKIEGRAVNPDAVARAEAPAAEQGQGQGTSPATTPPAEAPTPAQLTQDAPTGPAAKALAEQGRAQAATNQLPQALDVDKTLAEFNAQDPRVQLQIRNDLVGHGVEISRTGSGFTKEEVAAVAKAVQEGDLTQEDLTRITGTAISQKGAFISQSPFVSTIPAGMSQQDVRTMEEGLVKHSVPGSSYLTVDGQITPEEKQHLERMNAAPANSPVGEALANAGLKDEVAAALAGLQNKPLDVRDQGHDGEPPRAVGSSVDTRVAQR